MIHLANVGDGLSLSLYDHPGAAVHVDVGGSSPARAWQGFGRAVSPASLVLSHFHLDHYVGLLQPLGSGERPLDVRNVYFPRLPEFAQREDFAVALYSTLTRVFGSATGSIEADFLDLIAALNRGPWTYRPLSQGDLIPMGGRIAQVVWPPARLDHPAFVGTVRTALAAYDLAREEDPSLARIHERVYERAHNPFLATEPGRRGDEGREERWRGLEGTLDGPWEPTQAAKGFGGGVRRAVLLANQKLQRVANRLCLSFYESDNLLFLGDLEAEEIEAVVGELHRRGMLAFSTMITPHHGTHWDASLWSIACRRALTSNGPRMRRHYRTEFDTLAVNSWTTAAQGDIHT